jgi:adenosylhomocysteine nucleosidase
MKRIAILAAMPGELKPFVSGWEHEKLDGMQIWTRVEGERHWIAACAGAGQSAVTRAFAAIEQRGKVNMAISVGWVGALAEQFEPGTAWRVAGVIDQQTGERFATWTDRAEEWLVTSPSVADEAAKARLRATYNASLVDMEAAAIGRLATMRNIPFHVIKGVSDGVHDQLPDFNRFLGPAGEFRLGSLVLFALLRPSLWSPLIRMGENSKKAAKAIAEELRALLAEQG